MTDLEVNDWYDRALTEYVAAQRDEGDEERNYRAARDYQRATNAMIERGMSWEDQREDLERERARR